MMKQALTAACLAAGLAVAQIGTLAAETSAPAQPAPAAPGAAPEGTTPAPAAPADPRVERQRKGAAKLAGMIRFVDAGCPDAKPDYARFKQVIAAMGVDIKDLEQGPLMLESLGYTEAYKKDIPGSCKRAFEHFGESGTTIPGLLAHAAPDTKGAAPKSPGEAAPAQKSP